MSTHQFKMYFISDNVDKSTIVVETLQKVGVSDDCIGVISKDSDILRADLPELDLSERSKLPEALGRGAALGSGTGLLAGILLASFPVAGLAIGGAAVAGITAGGGAIGAWSASMIGISEQSPLVEKFTSELDNGKTIIVCDLDDAQLEKITDIEDKLTKELDIESGRIS